MAIRDFFGRGSIESSARPAATPQPASANRVGYDPLLIPQLRRDHRRLLDLFAVTQTLLTSRDYAGIQRKLGEFRILLQDNLVQVSSRLYVYLARLLATDPERTSVLNAVRRETLDSGREILDALRTYSAVRLDDQSAEMFQAELLDIGTRLMQRMEREESALFPLYRRGA
jgi:hypothetical protein